jgi:hypothetical protein
LGWQSRNFGGSLEGVVPDSRKRKKRRKNNYAKSKLKNKKKIERKIYFY